MPLKKQYESRKFGQFNVAGINYKNEGMRMSRLEWIKKYIRYGAKFKLIREPDNAFDSNAIKVKHLLVKSGKLMTVGYVPNNERNPLADKLAPLMDNDGWDPEVYFGKRHIIETEEQAEKRGLAIGTVIGLAVRYAK